MFYYQDKQNDREVIHKLTGLTESYPTKGFYEYYYNIRYQSLKLNITRLLRVYREMKFNLRSKHKGVRSNAFIDARKLRVFNVIDDRNRGTLAI
jgi:putative transposase